MYYKRMIGSRGKLFCSDAIPGCKTYAYLIEGIKRYYVVDTGLGSDSAQVIKSHIKGQKDIVVINTHYHWDHVWGNIGFEGYPIVAHGTTGSLIEQNWDEMELKGGKWKEGRIKKVLPDMPLDGRMEFEDDGIDIFHSPGHTGDSISVYDRLDGVLHVGDNIEEPAPSIYDTRENCISSLKKYLEYDFKYCISGHNDHVKREDIEEVIRGLMA